MHANPHLRWHPLRHEWVDYAAYRQTRTFLPPPEYNPLRPSDDSEHPTEMPVGDYDIAVFDNLFPALSLGASGAPDLTVPTEPGLRSVGASVDEVAQAAAAATRATIETVRVKRFIGSSSGEERGRLAGSVLHGPPWTRRRTLGGGAVTLALDVHAAGP